MQKLNRVTPLFFFAYFFVARFSAAEPVALVYRGPSAGCKEGCAESIADALKASRHGFDVKFVGPNEELPLSAETLRTASVYAQPGGDGDAGHASAALEEELGGKEVLVNWVRAGGRYYGTCLGAYVAGKPELMSATDVKAWGFGLLPGIVGQWIKSPDASVKNTREAVVEVTWEGEPRWIYFQDGPHFEIDARAADAHVVARYQSNGLPAAVVSRLGRGKVAVVGPHPEADHGWFKRAKLEDPMDPEGSNGHALDLARNLVDQLMAY